MVLSINPETEVTSNNVQEFMPAGYTCEEFLTNTIEKSKNQIVHQIVRVKVQGWSEFVDTQSGEEAEESGGIF